MGNDAVTLEGDARAVRRSPESGSRSTDAHRRRETRTFGRRYSSAPMILNSSNELRSALNRTAVTYAPAIEGVRLTLPKHEVPRRPGVYAGAPGYSRIDMSRFELLATSTWSERDEDLAPSTPSAQGFASRTHRCGRQHPFLLRAPAAPFLCAPYEYGPRCGCARLSSRLAPRAAAPPTRLNPG